MITEELKELVKQEADNLKKHATAEELERIDFGQLDPHLSDTCIYGQMTGWCFSDRAIDLLRQCAKPISKELWFSEMPEEAREFYIHPVVNRWFSAIEIYIVYPEAKNQNLISYIKGEAKTLEL